MKTRELRINKVFSVNSDNIDDAFKEVIENLEQENATFENECFECAELVEVLN
jgi:hypothetical protein